MRQDRARVLLADIAGDPSVIFVTGKGGVGKTTTTQIISQLARDAGLRSGRIHLGDFTNLEVPQPDHGESPLDASNTPSTSPSEANDIDEIAIEPEQALIEYLSTHGFGKLASRLLATGIIGVVATAIPGLRDLLLLGKIKQIEREGGYDVLIVDTPSSGHTITFLTSPEGLRDIAKVGPLRAQAEDVIDMLSDPQRSGCVIVTAPEETPVAEALETIELLRSKSSITIASIVVNQVLPRIEYLDLQDISSDVAEVRAYDYRVGRQQAQTQALTALRSGWAGPITEIPYHFEEIDSSNLIRALITDLDPESNGPIDTTSTTAEGNS